VGILHLFARGNHERRININAIAPVWDGNEVWLLTGGGALFAAFPAVYATVFSGFYLALMLVLFSLIVRAVSLEFRAHDEGWKSLWDWAFHIGSVLPALLFGVAVGNIALGIPLTAEGEFAGNFFTLLGIWKGFNAFALIIGVLSLVLIATQGATWLALKAEGELYDRAVKARSIFAWILTAMVVVGAAATFVFANFAFAKVVTLPVGWLFVPLLVVSILWGRMSMSRGKDRGAWYAISLTAVSLVGIWAMAIFPDLVPTLGPGGPLTIFNSSSSQLTLTVMLIIAVIGVPLVLFYMFLVYRAFKGKVTLDGEGY
jgi:cytochrome d ubiquinol oxidase subunit II